MNEAFIVIKEVIILLVLMLIGIASIKLRIMTVELYEGLGKFTISIALPALIFRTITTLGGRDVILSSIESVAISVILIAINFGVGILVAKLSGLRGVKADTHISATAIGNLGYIGLPIVSALYNSQGLLVVSIYMIFDVMLNWTIGINMMDQNKDKSPEEIFMSLVTPLNVTLLISIVLLLLNVTPSGLIFDTIAGIGSTTKYLSIIYLGAKLVTVNFKGAHKEISIYLHILFKLIAFPVIVYLLGLNFIDPIILKTFVIIMALPTTTSFPVFANSKGGDEDYSVKITFVGTLVSLITIPLVVWIITFL